MAKVLVIDDEEHIIELLKFNLELSGHEVLYSTDGKKGLELAKEEKPDIVLLDWMLPKISGIEILKEIREDKSIFTMPVIMLTAKNMENDKLEGLNGGADDFITKPFSVKELLARVKTVLRRYKSSYDTNLRVRELSLNLDKHEVVLGEKKLDLTLKEFELLKLLMENKGKVLKREYIFEQIWGYDFYGETRTVDVHIRYLRKKLEENATDEKYIETIRGVGYKMV